MMSIHAKRAAAVVALFAFFTVVRLAWPFLTTLVSGSGGLGAVMISPAEIVAEALIAWVLTYSLSKWWSRRPTARS
jgi:hypothetical protein